MNGVQLLCPQKSSTDVMMFWRNVFITITMALKTTGGCFKSQHAVVVLVSGLNRCGGSMSKSTWSQLHMKQTKESWACSCLFLPDLPIGRKWTLVYWKSHWRYSFLVLLMTCCKKIHMDWNPVVQFCMCSGNDVISSVQLPLIKGFLWRYYSPHNSYTMQQVVYTLKSPKKTFKLLSILWPHSHWAYGAV